MLIKKRQIFTLFFFLLTTNVVFAGDDSWTRTEDTYYYNKTDKIKSEIGSEGEGSVSYSFELGHPGNDIYFASSSCSPGTIDESYSNELRVRGKVEYAANNLPGVDVNMQMGGILRVNGSGGSGTLKWSATGTLEAPFYVDPSEGKGTSYQFVSYSGSTPVTCVWNSLTSGLNLSKNGSTVTASATEPGEYNFEGVYGSLKAQATFVRLKVKFEDHNGNEISSIKVIKGGSASVTSKLLPTDQSETISTSLSGTLSLTGSIPGSLTISGNTLGDAKIEAVYNSQVLGSLDIEFVEATVTLSIEP